MTITEIIEKMAEKLAVQSTDGYCKPDNHSHDCCCTAWELGYIEGVKLMIGFLKWAGKDYGELIQQYLNEKNDSGNLTENKR